MSDVASGRAMMLQKKIIEAIKRARNIDILSDGGVSEIFGELLDDSTIKDQVYRQSKIILTHEREGKTTTCEN